MQIECLNNKGLLCKFLENSGSYSILYCTSKVEAANYVQVDTACGSKQASKFIRQKQYYDNITEYKQYNGRLPEGNPSIKLVAYSKI